MRVQRGCETYAGILDISSWPTGFSFIDLFRWEVNATLQTEKFSVYRGVEYSPFYFDFVKAEVPNAHAVEFGRFSFIIVTEPLLERVFKNTLLLAKSEGVRRLLRCGSETVDYDAFLHVLLFRVQMLFVLMHEYTHLVHQHDRDSALNMWTEFADTASVGRLEDQAKETDADAKATFLTLGHMIVSKGWRAQALKQLACSDDSPSAADQILLATFVVAVGCFMFAFEAQDVSEAKLYRLSHPPYTVRMNNVMHAALAWCDKNRPALSECMNLEKFQECLGVVAEAIEGPNGVNKWKAQVELMLSSDGAEYIRALGECFSAHLTRLRSSGLIDEAELQTT